MKVIFLDHDGVMCLSQQWGGRFKKRKEWHKTHEPTPDEKMDVEYRFDNFDHKATRLLNKILDVSGAEIVVSSDWKLHATLEEMQDLYDKYEVMKKPIDMTPRLSDLDSDLAALCSWKGWLEKARAEEIRCWLKKHPEVTHWVAVDDLNMSKFSTHEGTTHENDWGLTNFVLTPSSFEGIKRSGTYEKIMKFLQ